MRAGTLIALNSTGPMLEGLRLCYVLYKKVESWEEMPQSAHGTYCWQWQEVGYSTFGWWKFHFFLCLIS